MDSRRLHYIDWLRVLAVLLLFPFHTGRVFNVEAFYVKGPQLSTVMGRVLSFIDSWHMPLLFVLAGASTYLAFGRRTRRQYAGERVRRLLVPFIFGILVLIPPQTWYGARFNSGHEGSYLRYLMSGAFLEPNFKENGDYFGGFGIGHLWFILFLFLISMVALWMWGGRNRETSRFEGLSRILASPGGWLLAGITILLAEAVPAIFGKNIVYYFAFFVLGYLALCSEQFMDAARRFTWLLLLIGLGGSVWWTAIADWRHGLADPSLVLVGIAFLGMTIRWLLIIGLLGLGSRLLNRNSPALRYLAQGSYPVYILHQTVIVVLAFYIVGMSAPWGVHWITLLVASVALTFLCYEGLRRVCWLRFLFGMRPLPSPQPAPPE